MDRSFHFCKRSFHSCNLALCQFGTLLCQSVSGSVSEMTRRGRHSGATLAGDLSGRENRFVLAALRGATYEEAGRIVGTSTAEGVIRLLSRPAVATAIRTAAPLIPDAAHAARLLVPLALAELAAALADPDLSRRERVAVARDLLDRAGVTSTRKSESTVRTADLGAMLAALERADRARGAADAHTPNGVCLPAPSPRVDPAPAGQDEARGTRAQDAELVPDPGAWGDRNSQK